jgi:2'-5' RNA ligase
MRLLREIRVITTPASQESKAYYFDDRCRSYCRPKEHLHITLKLFSFCVDEAKLNLISLVRHYPHC